MAVSNVIMASDHATYSLGYFPCVLNLLLETALQEQQLYRCSVHMESKVHAGLKTSLVFFRDSTEPTLCRD